MPKHYSNSLLQVHPPSEKDPVKLSIHHYPICTTYAFFVQDDESCKDKVTLKDPSSIEESVMDGKIVLGMNPYREICTLHLAGKMLIDKCTVLKLTHSAAENAKVSVDIIKNALERDEKARKSGEDLGLIYSMKRLENVNNSERNPQKLDIDKLTLDTEVKKNTEPMDSSEPSEAAEVIKDRGDGVVEMAADESSSSEDEEVQEAEPEAEKSEKKEKKILQETINLESDSEEEETQILSATDLQQKSK